MTWLLPYHTTPHDTNTTPHHTTRYPTIPWRGYYPQQASGRPASLLPLNKIPNPPSRPAPDPKIGCGALTMESQECCFQRNHLMMRILLGQSHTGRIPSYSTTNLHHIWVHTYVMSYEFYIRWKVPSRGCAACQNKGKVGGICAICISHRGEGLTTGQEKQNRGKISARQALLHFGAQTDTSSALKILALRHFWCTDRYSVH